jgi:predicted patatin/cPLA2 family phospholipase
MPLRLTSPRARLCTLPLTPLLPLSGKVSEHQNDTRFAARAEAQSKAFDAETDAACVVRLQASSALPTHAISADTDGEGWPDDLISDDISITRRRSRHFFLIENLAQVLPS